MDLNFWHQFCTSPMPGSASPDMSDLDSSPGWSPLSSLEEQENTYGFLHGFSTGSDGTPSETSPHHNHHHHNSLHPTQHHHNQSQQNNANHTSGRGIANSSSGGRTSTKNAVKRVQQRTAANHRERKRMKTINEAFEGLRERIPLAAGDRKLSKVDTLRLAIRYIHHLSDLVTACGTPDGQPSSAPARDAAKVIIRCHNVNTGANEYSGDANGNFPLYGHSLSWTDEKQTKVGPNGRLVAKLWVPESADPSTLIHTNYDCDSLPL